MSLAINQLMACIYLTIKDSSAFNGSAELGEFFLFVGAYTVKAGLILKIAIMADHMFYVIISPPMYM